MPTCEWCGLEIQHIEYYDNEQFGILYHPDCYDYGKELDREAIGWTPTVVPTETE